MYFPPCHSHNEQLSFFRNILYRLAHIVGWLCSLWGRNWICVCCWDETCVWARTSSCEICGEQNGTGTGFSWLLLFGLVRIILSVFKFTFEAARLRAGRTGEVLDTCNKSDTIPKIMEHEERKLSLCRLRYHNHHHHHHYIHYNVSSSYTFRNTTNMMTLPAGLQSWAVYLGHLWWTQDSVCCRSTDCVLSIIEPLKYGS